MAIPWDASVLLGLVGVVRVVNGVVALPNNVPLFSRTIELKMSI
jgi:hypothetical protein